MAPAGLLAFAGKSMAAAVIKEIIAKAFRYLDGYFTAETMEELKNKLGDGMIQIQAVLEVVSPDHIEDRGEALDQWLWKLRDAVEGAEDAIDGLEYYELEEKAKDHQVSDWGSPIIKAKHKVITSVKHVPILDKSVKQFTHRGTLKRLKKAIQNIDKAAAGAATFLEVVKFRQGDCFGRSRQEGIWNNCDRQTGSTSTVTKFVGRENEKKLILEWLTKKTTVEEGAEAVISPVHIPIFSLIGHGGMGKTTLAQTMCEHDDVAKDFNIIWVNVSTDFDATSVTRKILESVTMETPKTNSLEPLQQALKDKLKSFNKFLLILDDVWEDGKRNEWEKLFAPLRTMKSRSKILLTTRMASVAAMAADVMGVARESLTLEELQEDDNLELFNHHVFSGLNSQEYSELETIGEQIARKLKGCPLVTKVISGHLRGNMTSEFWERFLCEGSLNDFTGNSDDIMKVLRISYYHLPTELQTCFRYCSIFPQDYKFTNRELTMLWIGSGLISIREDEGKSHEEIVEQYLFNLWTKSFFDKRIDPHGLSSNEEHYVLHDLMHDLAEDVSSGEFKRITSPNRLIDVKDRIRHLHIENAHDPNVDNFNNIVYFKNLRTLVISSHRGGYISKQMKCIIAKASENSKALRLIQIRSRSPFKFPRKTSNLMHLRGIFVSTLAPECVHVIHKLYHLMVLDVVNRLEIAAMSVRNMGSLDHLRYLSYGTLGQFRLNRLTSLHELNNYQVQGRKGNKISDIRNLKYLEELEVTHLENVENGDEAMNAKMKEKKHLTSLSLSWSTSSSDVGNRIDDLVLDLLEPHANIRKLAIRLHGGRRPPFWINGSTFKKLVSFELLGCMNWEYLPCLEEFVLLQHLILAALPMLQQIGRPSLMASSSSMEDCLPPRLYSLNVVSCHELRETPILPTSLVRLNLQHVGLTNLPRIGKLHIENVEGQPSCLNYITIQDCPRLVSLEGSFLEQKQYSEGVRHLTIQNCICLETECLPLEQTNKTEELHIPHQMLGAEADIILPSSLESLSIGQCGNLEPPLLRSLLQCPTNLSVLRLQGCSSLISLPSAEVFCKNIKLLRELSISRCNDLTSLGGLGSLTSLSRLEISQCCKLGQAARSSLAGYASAGEEEQVVLPQLEYLTIDLPSLLLVQPLKCLRHTQYLFILNQSVTERILVQWLIQNCPTLLYVSIHEVEALPQSIRDLSSLSGLSLLDGSKLQSLPDLPLSLKKLQIVRCHPRLEKKIKVYGSPERDRISHIPRVEIGNLRFILGKECSKSTFDELRSEDIEVLSSRANKQKRWLWR